MTVIVSFTKLIMSFNADSDTLCLYFNPKIDRENSFNLMSETLHKYSIYITIDIYIISISFFACV